MEEDILMSKKERTRKPVLDQVRCGTHTLRVACSAFACQRCPVVCFNVCPRRFWPPP